MAHAEQDISLERGIEALRTALKNMPGGPGVYRMLDRHGKPLYVGKAKSLKKRVTTYANVGALPIRLQRMIAATAVVEVITTDSEVEALLLESNLIKRLRPHYNIVLRDDKSFPYILLRRDHTWAQITKYRGAKTSDGEYFGPFASAGAVTQTINALHRAFPLRSCSDSVLESRTRPCLQHQIKRCAAPCVGRISKTDYDVLVKEARAFLAGRSRDVQQRLTKRMTAASDALEFETAAAYRDRIKALAHIQTRQGINMPTLGDADVVAIHEDAGQTCVQVFFFRAGHNYGNRAFFPRHAKDETTEAILTAFIGQFYNTKDVPPLILVNRPPNEVDLLAEALSVKAERRVRVRQPTRGDKRKLIEDAERNAREALARRMSESATQRRLFDALTERFELESVPNRIEVYDNSHISGTDAIGNLIVAGPEGFIKNAYRKFNIRSTTAEGGDTATPGDDYAMMREVLTRRFGRLMKEDPERTEGSWPDLVLIDGGAGQLGEAIRVFADLGIADMPVAGIAKGPERNAGRERIFLPDRPPISIGARDPLLYFLQRLRDEAHRFAIGTHRAKRAKSIARSALDEIPGIGPRRKKALLHRFGSARGVGQAGLADLETVDGISSAVARVIYEHLHSEA
jgi:excinuclease ABC subunit C